VTTPYELRGFLERFDEWVEQDEPDGQLRIAVLDWIFSRAEHPYQGVRREPNFANLWFGAVPTTQREWEVVVCSYWIIEAEHAVRCDRFATLNAPI
jgi:hypothetical protein